MNDHVGPGVGQGQGDGAADSRGRAQNGRPQTCAAPFSDRLLDIVAECLVAFGLFRQLDGRLDSWLRRHAKSQEHSTVPESVPPMGNALRRLKRLAAIHPDELVDRGDHARLADRGSWKCGFRVTFAYPRSI